MNPEVADEGGDRLEGCLEGQAGLLQATRCLLLRGAPVATPRSIAELCLSEEEVSVLRTWALGLGVAHAGWFIGDESLLCRNLGAPWTVRAAFGLLSLTLAAEVGRREASSHSVWPTLAGCFREDGTQAKLFTSALGPRPAFKDAIEDGARAFDLRHAFDLRDRQSHYATIRLQFGLGFRSFGRLPEYLTGIDTRINALRDLRQRGGPLHSASFSQAWRALRRARYSGSTVLSSADRADLLGGGWIRPEWFEAVVAAAQVRPGLRDLEPPPDATPPGPAGSPRPPEPLQPPAEPAVDVNSVLLESCRLVWEAGGQPMWRVVLVSPDRLGLGDLGTRFLTEVEGAKVTWLSQSGQGFVPFQGTAEQTLPVRGSRLRATLLNEGGEPIFEHTLEALPLADGFALVPLPRGQAWLIDDVLPRNQGALVIALRPATDSVHAPDSLPAPVSDLRLRVKQGSEPPWCLVAGARWYRVPSGRISDVQLETSAGDVVWDGAADVAPASAARGTELSEHVRVRFVPDARAVSRQRASRRALDWDDPRPWTPVPGRLTIDYPSEWQVRQVRLDGAPLDGVATSRAGQLRIAMNALPPPGRLGSDGQARYELRLRTRVDSWLRSIPVTFDLDLVGAAIESDAGWRALDPLDSLAWTTLTRHRRMRVFGLCESEGVLHEGDRAVRRWGGAEQALGTLRAAGERLWVNADERRVVLTQCVVEQQRLERVQLQADGPGGWLDVYLAASGSVAPTASDRILCWSLLDPPRLYSREDIESLPAPAWRVAWANELGPIPCLVALAGKGGRFGVCFHTQPPSRGASLAFASAGAGASRFGHTLKLAGQQATFAAKGQHPEAVRELVALLRWLRAPLGIGDVVRVLRNLRRERPDDFAWAASGGRTEVEEALPEGLRLARRPDGAWRGGLEEVLGS
jgi:hypothetical protein